MSVNKCHRYCAVLFQIYVLFSSALTAIWSIHNLKNYRVNNLINEFKECRSFWYFIYTCTFFSCLVAVISLIFLVRQCFCSVVSSRSRVSNSISFTVCGLLIVYVALNFWGGFSYFHMDDHCRDHIKADAHDIYRSYLAFLVTFVVGFVWFIILAIIKFSSCCDSNPTPYDDIP